MADLSAQDVAKKLLVPAFTREGPEVAAATDPIADTPMVVTLEQLRPYDLNPRATRNPKYDDIKASIRERGLDAPPSITRRPGAAHYMIRNGGNTRLAILKELWSETKEDRFFRIPCLFRPWRGDIAALTGHLAENELRGNLSFIERALGVEKARELYEQEGGKSLTQAELARRLSRDGYPVTQSHISRMQDAVRFLLPVIPSVLYGGLGRPQIERLTALRKAAERIWERHVKNKSLPTDFPALFQEVLALFDGALDAFDVKRVQDELIGQLSQILGVDYDALTLEIVDTETRQRALSREPVFHVEQSSATELANPTPSHATNIPLSAPSPASDDSPKNPAQLRSQAPPTEAVQNSDRNSPKKPITEPAQEEKSRNTERDERLQGHIVSPADTTDRLQAIQRTIADATGDPVQDFQANVVRAIPVQAGGLHPISDVWFIEPALETPDRLRVHIAQLAREIAQEADLAHRIESVKDGIGFFCNSASSSKELSRSTFGWSVLMLLHALSAPYAKTPLPAIDGARLSDPIGLLLQGLPSPHVSSGAARLSDVGLVKLFRLIRLARRLLELMSNTAQPAGAPGRPGMTSQPGAASRTGTASRSGSANR